MNESLGVAIKNVRPVPAHSVEWWMGIIGELSSELQLVIGEAFSQDGDPVVDPESPSFSIWFWSIPQTRSPLLPSWSGVMAGGLLDGDVFTVTADLLLFDSLSKSRLQTTDGRSYMHFNFDTNLYEWKCCGWVRDEWGEWEAVAYPD